jgi:hypothetical protein
MFMNPEYWLFRKEPAPGVADRGFLFHVRTKDIAICKTCSKTMSHNAMLDMMFPERKER